MMELSELIQALLRWIHIVAGITWIGLLYFFNWVNGPFQATIDGGTKKVVVPELMPRALYWFRWGAAWTWVTGVLLLLLVFYMQRNVNDGQNPPDLGAWIMLLVTFLAFGVYDPMAKAIKDNKQMAIAGLVLTAVAIFLFVFVGGYGYRGYTIHVGAMFGTIMAANVWMRIWPSQQKIITAVKNGEAPDAALVALAGTRSRHNTYMSVPLVWTMVNQHTLASAPPGIGGEIYLLLAVGIGWLVVMQLYKKAGTIKGF
jgi:uncharacterized membrane protein